MKLLSLFFLFLCLIEIYGQRIRTTNTNQDVSTQEPKTPRGRGRSRFSASEELPSSSERPSSNRRASTRTRIHSNNPKAAADRRARPTTEAPRSYAVEEVNNDSPIDSFIRQSKPRVLTESRFEIPTVTITRRPPTNQLFRTSSAQPAIEELTVGGFGSTARAILQARGESLPVRTTTPVIDEAYLLNNFGSTIRSLKAAIRNDLPIQRATPLRSEVPILDQEDIPLRRSSLRGDPLPSLRGSDISLERQIPGRGRTRGQSLLATEKTGDNVRTNGRTNSQRKTLEQARTNGRLETQRKVIEENPVEEIARLEPQTENPEVPESVQGIFEESDLVTETLPLESSSESLVIEEEELRKTSGAEFVTEKVTEPVTPRETVISNRRASTRGRTDARIESQSTSAPRLRASRTRASQGTVEIYTAPSTRSRGARRRNDDTDMAESRNRGPSVFTAEQYQEVTSRSRTGRKIDSRFESVPERITVDLTSVASGRTRSSGRRATTAPATERSLARDRSSSRAGSRSRVIPEESTTATVSKTTYNRRPSSIDDRAFYGDKTSTRADIGETISREETSGRLDTAEPRAVTSRGNDVETSSNRRSRTSRPDTINSRSRGLTASSRRQPTSRTESVKPRNLVSSRHPGHRQSDEPVSYSEKPSRTRGHSPQTSTTTTEEPITIINRSKSRFSEIPPNIDESKLEVLPLFEREPKTVPSTRSRGLRSRSSVNRRTNLSHDHMQGSATENDVKFVEKPTTNAFTKVTVTRTQSVDASTSRTRLSTRTASTTASTSTTETTRRPTSSTTTTIPETTPTTKKWVTRAPPMIRESVVAEVNEVTSKSTFMRRKKVSKAKVNEVLARGSKKADVKLTDLGKKGSSEEIGDEDNYPEPFKALIQAKKKQVNVVESRPSQSSPRSSLPTSSISTTEKVFVTSLASSRGSSLTSRLVTTESPSKRSQLVNEIVNDNDNELEPKATITSTTPITPTRSARTRQLPRFSEKPKYTQKPRDKSTKSITEKPRYSVEKSSIKTTSAPKKTYSTKSYLTRDPAEHHSRRKALRSTALPPSTTPMNLVNRDAKFSAKFIRKEKSFDTNSAKNQPTKSSYSRKKGGEEEEKSEKNVPLTQTPKPSLPIKKFNSSRYSARYRSDPSQRSSVLRSTTTAPFYIPTIPTPAYVPTIPTIAPSVTPVGGIVAKKDKDLGIEVISFDDPVNTIQSADLVNGEYLTTDKNIRLSAMVKDGTTEKAVSIIERIINSITAISTTEAPNITTTTSPSSTSNEASKNSAILKLVTKKPTTKDKTIPDYQTNIIETITSEKPTTIIEKIRSSLSAIQSNEVESNRMARLLENEQTSPTITPRFAITSKSTASSTPSSTTAVSNTTPLTTNEPKISTANSLPSTTPMDSIVTSSTTPESSVSSTTTSGTTMMFTSTLSSSPTQGTSTTMSNIVEIMAVPGVTRISKAQTTTTVEPSTVPQSTASTTQAFTSTIAQSTETIQPTLGEILNGEILNGRTVNALASLLSSTELSSTRAPNFKTLETNQNSITSTTSVQSTTDQPMEMTPFTSPLLNTESTTQFPTSEDRLISSTLISTLMPASTTTQEPKTQRVIITSTTPPPSTTTTTTAEIKTATQRVETTTQRLTTTVKPQVKTTGAPQTSTGFPAFMPSTIFPSILTTLFPNLLRNAVTTPSSPLSTTRKPFTSPDLSNRIGDRFELLSTAGTTARPTTVLPQTTSQRISTTTTPTTTTTRQTTTQTTTESTTTLTTPKPTTTMKPQPTTIRADKSATVTPSTKQETDALFDELKKSGKLKNLNEEQRKNLEEIERIENEQAELLKQLTLLTTMFGGQAGKLPNLPPLPNNNPVGGNSNSLANRVIAMAMERDRGARSSTVDPPTVTTKKSIKATTKRPNSIQDQLPVSQEGGTTQRTTPSLEDVLRQYNLSGLSTPVPLSSTYGKTDEALLAAILKEQGIGPTTPKILGDKVKEAGLFEENPPTKPPRPKSKPKPKPTTTVRPVGGRLMQGLNWLLDILDPPTTKRPVARKPKAKPQPSKQSSGDDELLTNQPTRITPVVTAAPVTKPNLSQEEIQVLIKQLEAVQNDPNAADQLDFSKIKNLQNLINVNEGVQVTSAGQHGATSRATPRPLKMSTITETDPFLTEINKKPRSSTVSTLSVSNSIDEDVELLSTTTTTRTRVLPPVSLNPIPGIDNQGDSLIRGNLLTAAVNVTRAISSFLGSALQGATRGFRSLMGSGSAVVGNIAQTSSAGAG